MPHRKELGFKGPTFLPRSLPRVQFGQTGSAGQLLGLGRALQGVSQGIDRSLQAGQAAAGEQAGAIAAGQASTIDPETGRETPALVQSDRNEFFQGDFNEAFNRQADKIFQQRLETVVRDRVNELSFEFKKDPEGFRVAVQGFAAGLKESAGVPDEMAATFDNTVATLAAPHINRARSEVFKDTLIEAAAARDLATATRVRDARIQGRLIAGGGAAARDALDLFAKTMLQQRADLAGDVEDELITSSEADLQFLGFQSETAKEFVKGLADGGADQGLLERQITSGTLIMTVPVMDEKTGKLVVRDVNFDELLLPKDRDALARFLKTGADADAKILRSQVTDAVTVLEAGKTPPGLDQLTARAGSDPELARVLDEAVEESAFMGDFMELAPREQATVFAELNSKETNTAREVRRLGAMNRGQVATIRSIKEDPLAHAAAVGATTEIQPIEFGDPESLREREAQADMAGAFLDIEVSPLQPAEVAALEAAIEDAEADSVAAVFQSLRLGLTTRAVDQVAGQIAPDQPALAVALSGSELAPRVASEIVVGQRLVEQVPDVKPTKSDRETSRADVYGNLFQEIPSAMEPHVDAATAIYAARRVPGGDLSFDTDLYEEALRLVAGGQIDADGTIVGGPIEFNGQKILPPIPGMEEDEFRDLLFGLPPDTMVTFGNGSPVYPDGTPFDPAQFDAGLFQTDAQLLSVGPGQYRIFVPGIDYVFTPNGQPYVLDLRRAALEAGSGNPNPSPELQRPGFKPIKFEFDELPLDLEFGAGILAMPFANFRNFKRQGARIEELPRAQQRKLDERLLGALNKANRKTLEELAERVVEFDTLRAGESLPDFGTFDRPDLINLVFKGIVFVRSTSGQSI